MEKKLKLKFIVDDKRYEIIYLFFVYLLYLLTFVYFIVNFVIEKYC